MEKQVVSGPGVPTGIGPYSQAVKAGGFVFVAGQPGIDPATGRAAGPGFAEEAGQAFVNLEAVLRAAGSSPAQVVSTTVLVADIADFPELNARFGAFFPVDPPVRMMMQVPLPRGLRISIGCTAIAEG